MHDASREVIETPLVFDRLCVKADDVFGQGKKKEAAYLSDLTP